MCFTGLAAGPLMEATFAYFETVAGQHVCVSLVAPVPTVVPQAPVGALSPQELQTLLTQKVPSTPWCAFCDKALSSCSCPKEAS